MEHVDVDVNGKEPSGVQRQRIRHATAFKFRDNSKSIGMDSVY